MKTDYKTDKFLGPSGSFAGYVLLLAGIVSTFKSISGLILVAAGLFMGFTYSGTIIDFDKRRIKSYTAIFGLFRSGRWHPVESFDKFRIYKSNRSYTTYSRANIPLTLKKSDIRLDFLNADGTLKITINRFDSFEAARNEMTRLINDLHISSLEEWTR